MSSPDVTANAADMQRLTSFISSVDSDTLMNGFQLMAASKSCKFSFGGKATIRLLPAFRKKWLDVIEELSKSAGASIPNEIKQRVHAEFTACFKNGECIIEIHENGKRTAFASKDTCQKLREGKLLLSKKSGETSNYSEVKVIEPKDFQVLATTCTNKLQAETPPAPSVEKQPPEAAPPSDEAEAPPS